MGGGGSAQRAAAVHGDRGRAAGALLLAASIGTSFRQYYDYDAHNQPVPVITVPAAVTLATEPMYAGFPRSLAERTFADLRHWSAPGRGGHFMALEEPELLAAEVGSFFRSLE